jgi:mono/diheme cytochrome c family protein
MRTPVTLNVALLVVGSSLFYTYVGQLVPQKQLLPPAEVEIAADLTTDQMIKVGFEVVQQKGLCLTCHTIGKAGGALRFPDLAGVGDRAKNRKPGYDDIHYLAESLYHPDAFIVPGFNPGMPTINKPPIGLSDKEILCVIAWLQSLGGTPSVTMTTKLPDQSQG